MNYLDELKKLNLPLGEYAVFGSGVLAIRGLRENRDLDIIVSDKLWNELIRKHSVSQRGAIEIGNIEIWNEKGVKPLCDITGFIVRADIIGGIPYVCLEDLRDWKIKKGREKDLEDVRLIDDFLNQH